MACRSCKRQMLLLARRANTAITTELYSAAHGQQLLRRVAATSIPYEQRRGFQSTSIQSSFLKNVRDTVGQVVKKSSEPYRVVAATKQIYEACSGGARYKIDPIAIIAGTIPKTAEGEHIGEGKGMWHEGKCAPLSTSRLGRDR
jgi:cytochrome b pre-mRNA-processing protein 3